jgi:spermidine synthase
MSFGTCRYLVIKMAALLLVVAVCLWWTERENVMWHHRFVEKIDGVYSPLFLFRQDNAPSIVDVATSSFGYQSGLDRDNLATPVSDYLKLFATLSDLAPPTQSVLFVGGSLMSAPIALSLRHPNSHSDVIEMEPAYVPLVDLHGMGLDDRIHIYVDDARVKLQRIQASTFYDYIVLDAYSSDGTIPPHLVTREFFALIKNMLRPEGFVAMNVVGSWEGKDAELAHSVHATLKSVFPYIEVLPMQDPVQRGNIVFVAGSESLAAPLHLLLPSTTLSLDPRAIGSGDGIIFTDAYVPIEKYTPWYRPNFRLREKILFTAADLIRGY